MYIEYGHGNMQFFMLFWTEFHENTENQLKTSEALKVVFIYSINSRIWQQTRLNISETLRNKTKKHQNNEQKQQIPSHLKLSELDRVTSNLKAGHVDGHQTGRRQHGSRLPEEELLRTRYGLLRALLIHSPILRMPLRCLFVHIWQQVTVATAIHSWMSEFIHRSLANALW